MKNLYLLPTDKPSRLIIYSTLLNEFRLLDAPIDDWKHKRNIYITSDEEIKRYGEYYLDIDTNEVKTSFENMGKYLSNEKKIILTTDEDLIKDGVQAIDDEFLEWFVKNPSCEEVEIKHIIKEYVDDQDAYGYDVNYYKIIIPKEEPKQETLEEIIKPLGDFIIENATPTQGADGAYYHYSEVCKLLKLQQEQNKNKFSEEDIMKAVKFGELYRSEGSKSLFEKKGTTPTEVLKKWLDQLKNK